MSALHIYSALTCGVFMLSTSAIFARLADASPVIIAFYRLLFASCALWPAVLIGRSTRGELSRAALRDVLPCVAGGFFLAVHYVMWFMSIRLTNVSSSTVLASLQPLFSMFLGWMFLGEGLSKKSAVGAAIALAGTFIIGGGDFRADPRALVGDVVALISGAVISLYYFFGQIACRRFSNTVFATIGYSSSVVTLLSAALIMGTPFTGYSRGTWGCFLGLAFVSTIGGQMVLTALLKHITATMVTMSILAEPIGVCILAAVFLREFPTPQLMLGMPVILAGLFLFFGGQKKKASA